MEQKRVMIGTPEKTAKIFGSCDSNISIIEKRFGVDIRNCEMDEGSAAVVSGSDPDAVERAARAVSYLSDVSEYKDDITDDTVAYVTDMIADGMGDELCRIGDDCICLTAKGKPIKAKTVGQKYYIDAIKKNTIVLGSTPLSATSGANCSPNSAAASRP